MMRRRMAMLAALMASIASSSCTLSEAQSRETDAHEAISDENMNNVESTQQEKESAVQTVINEKADEPGSRESDASEAADDERIRGSVPVTEEPRVKRDPRPVSEQVKVYYEQTLINEKADEPGSRERDTSEAAGDERIRGSGPVTEEPRVKRDPRPVSEQVGAYYEHISRGSGESEKESGNVDGSSSEEEQSHNSVEADLEGLGNKSSQSGENTSADTPSIKTGVKGESNNNVDVNDETETRNLAHQNTDAVHSDAPNESTNKESEAIKEEASTDSKQEIYSAGSSNDRIAEEKVKKGETSAPESGEKLSARDNPNAPDPSTETVLDTGSNTDNSVEDGGSSSKTDPPGEYDDEAAHHGTKRSQVNDDDMNRTDQEPISDDTNGDPPSSIIDDKDVRIQNGTIRIESPEPRTDEGTAEAADEPIDRSSERVTDKMAPSDEETMHQRDSYDNETAAQTASGSPKDAATDNESTSNSTFPTSDETPRARDSTNLHEEVIDFDIMDGKIEESPENEASKEAIGNPTSSNNAPPNNIMPPKKPEMEEYIDDDVIDFDIIDNLNSGSNSGQDADARTDTLVIEKVASDSHDNKSSHETEHDITQQNASEESAPKKGSIAEFYHKVSQKEAVDFGSTTYIRPAKSATVPENATDSKVTQNDPQVSSLHEKRQSSFEEQAADSPHEYSGGWGVRTETAPRTTTRPLPEYLTKPLYTMTEEEVESSRTQRESDSIYQEVLNGVDISGAASQDSADDTPQVSGAPDESVTTESKSVNSEFVDGLDDIDKFFQSVDPPDELDVGAAGSSIQEVLVGQSVKIVLNRVKLGFRFLRKRLGKVKARIDKFVSRRRTQDGEVALITREDIKSTVDSLKRLGKQTLRTVKDLVDDLFADEDDDDDVYDIDNGLDQVRAKINSLRREQERIQVPQRPNTDNRMPP